MAESASLSTEPSIEQLAEHVRSAYALGIERIEPIPGGDADSSIFRVQSRGGMYFLKLRRGAHAGASMLARHLADAGIVEVLAPLDPRRGARELDGVTVTLYPFFEGENAFRRPLSEPQWKAFGATMRSVHNVALSPDVVGSMRRETYDEAWRIRVRDYAGANRRRTTTMDDDAARKVNALLSANSRRILALVRHAEQLAASLRRRRLLFVSCHADLHAGNVLVSRDGTIAIVDWDDLMLAPKERDLMFIGGGVGHTWNSEQETGAFYAGYGPTDVDREALAYYRCDRIVQDVVVYCDALLRREGTSDERADSLRRISAAFDPNDVVEIAERTVAAV